LKLSVVVPVYNEIETLEEIIRRIDESPVEQKEIIVIDDFSTDGTRELIEKVLYKRIDRFILHERNLGKGAALRSGFKVATGDLVIVQDADLEYDPAEYTLLMKPVLEGKADVVYGSRFTGIGPHRVLYFWHYLGNRFLTLLSNMFTNLNLTDMETCYKLFRREIIQSIIIRENRFGFEPEVTMKIARRKCRIFEVGISYYGRTYEEGKKISWKDGIRAVYVIIKFGLFFRRD
jgi:glycosyltransferase involved in cell wall biosynthesis